MKKVYFTHKQLINQTNEILRQMAVDNWKPDYIVGLTRGGLIPAVYMSHYLEVPMHALSVSLRDGVDGPESNLWMAEDAYGYQGATRKKILIIDDINDTGATLQWIKDDWVDSMPNNDDSWDDIWGNSVRFSTLINNEASRFTDVQYSAVSINKVDDPQWIVFPFENQF